jgi:hypothetical protein
MKYPFYKHFDIKILYIFIGLFIIGSLVSLYYMFIQGLIFSVVGLFSLLIVIIGHEIMIILLDIKNTIKVKS